MGASREIARVSFHPTTRRFSVLVWLTRLFFSFPEGLGSVNQITAFEAASSQGTNHTEEAWLSHSAFCLLLMGGPWWVQLGVRPPAL